MKPIVNRMGSFFSLPCPHFSVRNIFIRDCFVGDIFVHEFLVRDSFVRELCPFCSSK